MIFYHGTTLDAAMAIQREGLIPHRTSAYQLFDPITGVALRDIPSEKKPYIYLTLNKDIAEMYAQFRAQYERATKGEAIDGGGIHKLIKLTSESEPNAKPAIVELSVPQTIARQFKPDKQETRSGYNCACVIPPKYIRSIQEVQSV